MLAKSKLFKRVGSFLFAFLMLFTVFASVLPATVHADEQARFIDRVTISYKDRIWTSVNPYNLDNPAFSAQNRFSYVTGPLSCRHVLKVNNVQSANPTATVEFHEKDSDGDCNIVTSTDNNVQFSASGNKFVNAYRVDADRIFAPVGFEDNGRCPSYNKFDLLLGDNVFKDTGPGVTPNSLNTAPATYVGTTFRRPSLAQRQQQNLPANYYEKIQANGDATNLITLSTEGGVDADVVVQADACTRREENRFRDIVLANNGNEVTGEAGNCIPRRYEAPQKSCGTDDNSDPTEPPDDGGDGANGPSCEEANSSIIVSWIVCGLVQFFDDAVTKMATIVDNLLAVEPERYNNAKLRESWSYFRNIASFMLIIIGLVMIIGQAVSKE